MVKGLYEAHLVVSDLNESARFYEEVVGLTPAYDAGSVRFFWIGGEKQSFLGLWQRKEQDEGSRLTGPDVSRVVRQHVALQVAVKQLREAVRRLRNQGVAVYNFYGEEGGPLYVHTWIPAVSCYFSDPDGHALELIAVLADAPRPDWGATAWADWEERHGRERHVHTGNGDKIASESER